MKVDDADMMYLEVRKIHIPLQEIPAVLVIQQLSARCDVPTRILWTDIDIDFSKKIIKDSSSFFVSITSWNLLSVSSLHLPLKNLKVRRGENNFLVFRFDYNNWFSAIVVCLNLRLLRPFYTCVVQKLLLPKLNELRLSQKQICYPRSSLGKRASDNFPIL